MNILLTIDGVLKGGSKQEPIHSGMRLYWALKEGNRVILLADEPRESAEFWLAMQGLSDFDDLIDSSVDLVDEDRRKRQIRLAKSRGPIAMLVDPDPSVIADVYEDGLTGLLFVHPAFAAPQFRPDAPSRVRAWTDIEASVRKQKLLASQTRFADGMSLGWDEG